jgi:hypothetical protein
MCGGKLSDTSLADFIQKKSLTLFARVKIYVQVTNVHAHVRGVQNRTRQTSMRSCAVRNALNIIGDVDTNANVENVVDKHVLFEKNIWSHDAAVLGSPNNGDAETVSSLENNIECCTNHVAYNADVVYGDKHVLGEKDACSHEETFQFFR